MNPFLAALSISLLILLGCSSQAQGPIAGNNSTSGSEVFQNSTPQPQPSGISSAELAKHSDSKSCWVLFNGTVYDMTDYLNMHPGGASVILPTCGKPDSSFADAFEGKHGTKYVDALASVAPIQGKFAG